MAVSTETAIDWRADLREILGDEHDYAREFVEAVALDVAGDTLEALLVAGQTLEHLGSACHWLAARFDVEGRKLKRMRPYRNLTLPERRAVDLAPVELAKQPEIRDAMGRHNRLLPDLESLAVVMLHAESKISERPTH